MFNLDEVRTELIDDIDALSREVETVYAIIGPSRPRGGLTQIPKTLLGYIMSVFARIDLLSAFWSGSFSSNQTARMVDFMDKYVRTNREANSVAVQIWRHKLMHTGKPRYLMDERTGKRFSWLLYWRKVLPHEQHYTFAQTNTQKILNVALVYLIDDLRKGVEKYLADLSSSPELQSNYEAIQSEINSYKFKMY
jgi:hypothetical protein